MAQEEGRIVDDEENAPPHGSVLSHGRALEQGAGDGDGGDGTVKMTCVVARGERVHAPPCPVRHRPGAPLYSRALSAVSVRRCRIVLLPAAPPAMPAEHIESRRSHR
jgi:hypothetical protein